jgi:mannonate dehydratase
MNSVTRRRMLAGILLGGSSLLAARPFATAQTSTDKSSKSGAVKIRKVRAITTAPDGIRLVVVKVETDQPGLYGLGCATFNQRPMPVVEAVKTYLDPFCEGRNVDDIEDIWQTAYTSSYWRNGPVLNNALSGLDMALWDIKGKRAGMPVYQLLGGKCRFAVDLYAHAGGREPKEVEDSVRSFVENGYRHVRIQLGGYGASHLSDKADFKDAQYGSPTDEHMDAGPYLRKMPKVFEHVRSALGDEVELLHDVHERVNPIEAIRLVKEVEKYRPFFIEDPFPPEQNGYFKMLRQQSACPLAMGELFNNPHEWVDLVTDRLIDFIRVHISQIGGLTPARKLASLCEQFAVRTAWHGPGDVSPVGHACNAHLDMAVHNFGIQEGPRFGDRLKEIFPGCPEVKNGYMYVNDKPGFGIDIDETLAAKYPLPEKPGFWTPVRRRDGTAVRP